jgi:L-threonylcarbamoyladenylate synthase
VKTLQFVVDPKNIATADAVHAIDEAAAILRSGGLVALPTETVYGLGANAFDATAVASIFAAKQRPAWDPVIVHISDLSMLDGLVQDIPDTARKLMKAYWPGPLTLLLPRTPAVPDAVTAGRPLVGVRMPAHPVALALIRRAGVPVAAPSANLFGHISPTTAAHVLADLDGAIDAIIDAGSTEHGVESTVLDPLQTPMMIYRPGAITSVQIRYTGGAVEIYQDHSPLQSKPSAAMPSPGVGLRHYAPRARLILIDCPPDELAARLAEEILTRPNERIGIMRSGEIPTPASAVAVFDWGTAPEEMAHALYAGLRALDDAGCTVIFCPLPPPEGIGAAIRDRLRRAAA